MARKQRKKELQEESLKKALSFLEDEEPVTVTPVEVDTTRQEDEDEDKHLLIGNSTGDLCSRCKFSYLEECISFSGRTCEFFVYCPNCNAYICTYKPMPHQIAFHEDEHMKKLYAGGFGSAKTYTCGMEFIAYALQIPNGAGLIGAATWGQAGDTCLKFIMDNIPMALVAHSNQDKVNWYIDLINGFKISAKALDKEGKIRSANLNIIWIEEASEVNYSIVAYLQARLRNKTAFFKGKTRLKMLLSSNPDVGWLNSEWLMISSNIYYHGNVQGHYEVPIERLDPSVSTHISATSANIYLPADYEKNLAKNKPAWWVSRYLHGSFEYTEGLVYPDFTQWFIDPFVIPKHWKRITGTDFGRRDPTAHVVGALDPVSKTIYIYDELEESLDDRTIDWIAAKIKEKDNFPNYLLAYPHQCDPRGRNSDQVSGQSWIDAYREFGIVFQTARDCEGNSLAPTITKVTTYAKNGKLKIFKNCKKLYTELSKYKYEDRDLGTDKNQGEKPKDSHNHLPDALRYCLAPFPQFPASAEDWDEIWNRVMRQNSVPTFLGNTLLATEDSDAYVVDFIDNFG